MMSGSQASGESGRTLTIATQSSLDNAGYRDFWLVAHRYLARRQRRHSSKLASNDPVERVACHRPDALPAHHGHPNTHNRWIRSRGPGQYGVVSVRSRQLTAPRITVVTSRPPTYAAYSASSLGSGLGRGSRVGLKVQTRE